MKLHTAQHGRLFSGVYWPFASNPVDAKRRCATAQVARLTYDVQLDLRRQLALRVHPRLGISRGSKAPALCAVIVRVEVADKLADVGTVCDGARDLVAEGVDRMTRRGRVAGGATWLRI